MHRRTARVGGAPGSSSCAKRPGGYALTSSYARANPLIGLTAEEYRDFASALVSYVALHATVEQTTYFLNLCRDYTREIAGKVSAASKASRHLVPVLAKRRRPGPPASVRGSVRKKSLSH
jgi:hypothetical protein